MPTADELLGPQVASDLLISLQTTSPEYEFPTLEAAGQAMDGLALRKRVDLLADALLQDLPDQFAPLAQVVKQARDGVPGLDGWMIWPVTVAIARRVVEEDTAEALDAALGLLASLTSRCASCCVQTWRGPSAPRRIGSSPTMLTYDDGPAKGHGRICRGHFESLRSPTVLS